jgi:hypothetical protein
MGFLVSPGLAIKEVDLSNSTPGVSSSVGGFSGAFTWGPVLEPQLISSERQLVEVFGTPKPSYNRKDFFSVAAFLRYSNACWVVRTVGPNAKNAVGVSSGDAAAVVGKEVFVPNFNFYETAFTNPTGVDLIARYPGTLGNGIEVHVLSALTFGASTYAPLFDSAPQGTEVHVLIVKDGEILEKYDFLNTVSGTRRIDGTPAYYVDVLNSDSKYVYMVNPTGACNVVLRGGTLGAEFAKYSDIARSVYAGQGNGTHVYLVDFNNYDTSSSAIKAQLDTVAGGGIGSGKPSATGVSMVIMQDGFIRETIANMNKDTLSVDYYVTKISSTSNYIDMLKAVDFTDATQTSFVLSGATTDVHPGDGVIDGYELLSDVDLYDIGLLFQGAASNVVGNRVVEIAEHRKFTVGFVSPQYASIKLGGSTALTGCLADRQAMYSSSYGFMDSNWGLIYDTYNKSQVWVPMNPYSAGLQARVEFEREAWYAGMGFNYGKIAGVIRLIWEQNQSVRDALYQAQVNPLCTFRNEGIVLFGSKTLQTKPSAFDRINVRRLFIVVEKAISRSMKYFIGELNTEQTRTRVLNTVNPFLRDIKAKQGITDFIAICDISNNTPQVIDTNGLALDIALKPSRTIDFVYLNFYSVPTGVEFKEVFK